MSGHTNNYKLLNRAAQTIAASYAALPDDQELQDLINDATEASARGYFDPVEDEKLREVYTRYLGLRSAIWEEIQNLKPLYKGLQKNHQKSRGVDKVHLQAFGIAFSGAEIIVRTGEFLIGFAYKRDLVWKKLDEAEARYNLERKSFTRIYRQLTSYIKMKPFYRAVDFFDTHRKQILSSLMAGGFKHNVKILENLNLPEASRGDHLKRYGKFVRFSLERRRKSAQRNIMFSLFEGAGEDIADLKIPFLKAPGASKRVTPDVIRGLINDLQPGDVFITRHDDAMSNLFLPGFWPHAALFIGGPQERKVREIVEVSDGIRSSSEANVRIIESKKDGVLLRDLSDTLSVDAFVVMRPKLSKQDINRVVNRALSHAGKLYDFIFDFSTSDRLVCTELVYRAFQGIGDIDFTLSTGMFAMRMPRLCQF